MQSTTDKDIPSILCELGNAITFKMDDVIIFQGYIFDKQKLSTSSIINLTCYDRGIYLRRNQGTYKFKNETPEAITRKLCKDFGIPVGDIATTGIKISRNFVGVNLYAIIQSVYTLASEKNGKKYITYFAGDKLMIREKKLNKSSLIIESGKNLMSTSTSESISNMINQVAIYNDKNNLVKVVKDQSLINSYGLMQSVVKQASKEDATSKANKLLSDNGVTQKITVENLGDIGLITGNTVVVRESVTGVYGLFFIDNDIHTWKNGNYYNKLIINYKNMMDEQSVGTIADANTSTGTSNTSTNTTWKYLFRPGGESEQ